jgi:hypothetical protein
LHAFEFVLRLQLGYQSEEALEFSGFFIADD